MLSNRVITNKDSCLMWCEISNSLIGRYRLFKGSSCLDNEERNSLWNSAYVYQTTRRRMSEGINIHIHRCGKILCHINRLNFTFIYSFSTLFHFLPSFLSTIFLFLLQKISEELISSVEFTFLILHEDSDRKNLMRLNTLQT
jgi:hypothetical protein